MLKWLFKREEERSQFPYDMRASLHNLKHFLTFPSGPGQHNREALDHALATNDDWIVNSRAEIQPFIDRIVKARDRFVTNQRAQREAYVWSLRDYG